MQRPQLVVLLELFHKRSEAQEALKDRVHIAGLGQVGEPETDGKGLKSERGGGGKLAEALRHDPLPVAGQLIRRQQVSTVLQGLSRGGGPQPVHHVTFGRHVRSHTLLRLKAEGHG